MDDFATVRDLTPAACIDAFAAELTARAAALPGRTLLPGEEQVLGGYLFAGAEALVLCVGEALREHPELFPTAPVSGEALLGAQERATAWLLLREQLALLLRRVQQAYLKEQGEAVRAALCTLERVRHEDALPPRPGGPDRLLRDSVLAPARRVAARRARRRGPVQPVGASQRAAARREVERLYRPAPVPPGASGPRPSAEPPAEPLRSRCTSPEAGAAETIHPPPPSPPSPDGSDMWHMICSTGDHVHPRAGSPLSPPLRALAPGSNQLLDRDGGADGGCDRADAAGHRARGSP
ncbi:MAG: hypothetical protein RMK29_12160 [Myxococcales bacterium]|nr:hypothetical protein [Myxococcota bacterium]MDW8282458.1 hypothetical protein [Myxococcales bacterium]